MPSTLPSSFASAAAGMHQDGAGRNTARQDGPGFGDWPRRANGATQTFRRSSHATAPAISTTAPRESSGAASTAAATTHQNSLTGTRNGHTIDTRYTRSQLLGLFKEQMETGDLEESLAELYVGENEYQFTNGAANVKWSRRDDSDITDASAGVEACWERQGASQPAILHNLTDAETELFTGSINSLVKVPLPNNARDNTQREGPGNRRGSLSHGGNSGQMLASPAATRMSNRRREPSESYPFPRDTLAGDKDSREDDTSAPLPPPSLLRRRTDMREMDREMSKEEPQQANVGLDALGSSLKRAATGAIIDSSNPISPWSSNAPSNALTSLGTLANFPAVSGSPSLDKRPGFGGRSESKFRNLMSKDTGSDSVEKPATGSGPKVADWGPPSRTASALGRASHNADPFAFAEGELPTGSAALGGAHDESPPPGTPGRGIRDEHGFNNSSTSYPHTAYQDLTEQRRDVSSRLSLQSRHQHGTGTDESMSPTFTNPYDSPDQYNPRSDNQSGAPDTVNFHLPGLGGGLQKSYDQYSQHSSQATLASLGNDGRQFDRPPASSASRGFPPLGGLGGLGSFNGLGTLGGPNQWSSNLGPGISGRERGGFADHLAEPHVRSLRDAQPLSGLGAGGGSVTGSNVGTIGRTSKLGALFNSSFQDSGRGDETGYKGFDAFAEPRAHEDAGSMVDLHDLGANLPGVSGRRSGTDSPFRRGKLDDFFGGVEKSLPGRPAEVADTSRSYSPTQHPSTQHGFQSGLVHAQESASQHMASSVGSSGSGQLPAAQQKTMVMPDRIRWIYRDPQGNTQGPWSGLEMHDWYRAGFFSPELLVKKAEDPDYEPLAQLIRRIGNSREPFLVPQIGIPGPPSLQAGNAWPSQTAVASTPAAAAATQPPFANSFPSFGTTLTAEQQNALERRKQEEQYLMARQKEHLAQQQGLVKHMQMQGQHAMHPQLHHRISQQSLQSQPTFGNIAAPNNFHSMTSTDLAHSGQPSAGAYDNSAFRFGGGVGVGAIGSGLDKLGHIKEEDTSSHFDRQNATAIHHVQGASNLASRLQGPQGNEVHGQRVTAAMSDREWLRQEQAEQDRYAEDQQSDVNDRGRLEQFHKLRHSRKEDDSDQLEAKQQVHNMPQQSEKQPAFQARQTREQRGLLGENEPQTAQYESEQTEGLSLTEQVQKAASAMQSPAGPSPWARVDSSTTDRFPSPPSQSPLPAPAARRSRQSVADALAVESISQRASPSVETPSSSLAPWAREMSDAHKLPSMKEIQEAEAREAARRTKQEEAAAAIRRAALEKELAAQPALPAPGLPSSATWAAIESAGTPTPSAGSAWVKAAPGKAASVKPSAPVKKTLAQIQMEEEALARKQRAAATAATNATLGNAVAASAQSLSSGKRYADLAGKPTVPPAAPIGNWTTVGASGKVKPAGVPSSSATSVRAVSSGSAASAATAVKPKPANSRTGTNTSHVDALEEFRKWAVAELRPELSKGIQVEDFVQGLLTFPNELDVITEAVHSVSNTLDSRHFAEEFLRRRALAEKGKMDPALSSASSQSAHANGGKGASGGGGGWSEVARKGPVSAAPKEDSSAFKIVAAKKKGGR